MNLIELIDTNKEEILLVLYEWAETFDFELDEEGERTSKPYNYVFDLAERFEKGECDKADYQDILFHIEQINHDEIKIQL
jgi:hypothetical protein